MKNWIRFTHKACLLAFCAAVIPTGYESLKTTAGWPYHQAAEGIIPDSLIIRKQGFETAVEGDAANSQWNSFPDASADSRPSDTVINNQNPAGNGADTGSDTRAKTRVIRSTGTGGNKTGPGGEAYSPVMTVSTPITGYLGGSKITLLANQTASQMMSVLVETNQGKIIMIDGGVEQDAAHLTETLLAKGGRVDTWLITHPHSDHIGALNYILSHPECGITIDNLYYSFANLSWYQEYEAYRADMVEALMNTFALLPQEKLHGDIYKGQEIWVDNIKITVMNKPYLQAYNSINNSSVAYMLDINGKKALFLGDMGAESGKQFIEDNPPEILKCDILQMAHHGQDGVGLEVYKVLSPEICLWPSPDWLWNNDNGSGVDSGSWKTLEVRSWMAQLGVPYHVCIKDGDQVIQ